MFVKDTVANASHSKRGMEIITSDDPFVLIFAFIFLYIFIPNYDFRFRNAIILLGAVIVFFLCILHICIFVCMQASLCDVSHWFLGLF